MRWNRTWQPEIEGVPVPVFIPLPVNNTTTASPMDTTGTISPEIDVLVEDALNASATKALRAEPQSTITENGPYHGPFEGTTTTLPDCSEEPTSTTSTVAEPLPDVFTPSDVEEDVFIPSDIEDGGKKKKKGKEKKGKEDDKKKNDGEKKDAAAVEQPSEEHTRSKMKRIFAESLKETLKKTLLNT